jgi:DNA-binding LacI/PurR family transcriptional regulator
MTKRTATIADVAKAAHVSASTVSYAMSGKRPISATTKRRIEQTIAELDFSPNAGARALASRRTFVIGLQAPLRLGVDVHVIMEFVTGTLTAARAAGYDILLLTKDDAGGLARTAHAAMVDGLIIMDVEADDPRVATLKGLQQPSVLIGLPLDARGLSCVDFDFEAAGREAVDHLVDLGHTQLALIGAPPAVFARHTSYADRLTHGFRQRCEERTAQCSIHPCGTQAADVGGVIDALLDAMPAPTALLIHNERALPHALARLASHGLSIPGDISVLALCPDDVAAAQTVPVSSIDIPAEQIGAQAAGMLVETLATGRPVATRLVAPRLQIRATTGVCQDR